MRIARNILSTSVRAVRIRKSLVSWMFALLLTWLISNSATSAFEGDWLSRTVFGTGQDLPYSPPTPKSKPSESSVGQPFGIEVEPSGTLLVTSVSQHTIWRVDLLNQNAEVIVGTGQLGYAGDNGLPNQAQLNEPYEVRRAENGDLYWVEMKNHLVRRLDQSRGVVVTVAGTGVAGFAGDGGPAIEAQFSQPHSLVIDERRQAIYVADIGNHRIRVIDLETGRIDSLAGNGDRKLPEPDSLAQGTPVLGPRALALSADRLWVALREGHSLWSIDLESRRWRWEAGTGERGFDAEPVDATEARFDGPKGIAMTPGGDVVIIDTENHAVRVFRVATRQVETLAGNGPESPGDAEGLNLQIRMRRPHGVAVDASGKVYVGDSENHRVRMLEFSPLSSSTGSQEQNR